MKCTHGATIGQMEENALFYLRSRGIDEASARRLLLLAFAGECLERMKSGSARDHAERLIHEHLFAASYGMPRQDVVDGNEQELQHAGSWEEVG